MYMHINERDQSTDSMGASRQGHENPYFILDLWGVLVQTLQLYIILHLQFYIYIFQFYVCIRLVRVALSFH